jgi:SAM-dependent methyltransferase
VPGPLPLAAFIDQLNALAGTIGRRDPDGVDYSLRLAIAETLYLLHDALRSQDHPFDRELFSQRLQDAHTFAERLDPVQPAPGVSRAPRPAYETYVADLYSRCWAKYDDEQFARTVGMFVDRLRLNGVDLDLTGAQCLDAGCGSGRYTMAMAQAGGAHALGVDLSARAAADAGARAERLGYGPRVSFMQGSVIDLPPGWSGRFDFVCSNGVVHHTPDPIKGLAEIHRVLKPGGRAFVMVYGSGGLFWALTDFCRDLIAAVPLDVADAWLAMRGTPVGKVFFCLDHWYTQYQERVTREEFEARLRRAGFTEIRYLPRAMIYDASERYERFPAERDLIGSPDMRYLVTRA